MVPIVKQEKGYPTVNYSAWLNAVKKKKTIFLNRKHSSRLYKKIYFELLGLVKASVNLKKKTLNDTTFYIDKESWNPKIPQDMFLDFAGVIK